MSAIRRSSARFLALAGMCNALYWVLVCHWEPLREGASY